MGDLKRSNLRICYFEKEDRSLRDDMAYNYRCALNLTLSLMTGCFVSTNRVTETIIYIQILYLLLLLLLLDAQT